MKERIIEELRKIEKEKNIKILLACETGSRAWGFPSPDSDYDVRILYCHPKDWYLQLGTPKDTIEIMLENNDLDFTGWDLRKALGLLWKSNPPLLERIQSPIIYIEEPGFRDSFKSLAQECYSKIGTMHHYLSMSKKIYDEISSAEEYKLKKFFYGVRTAIACKWIMERDEMPPIEFGIMLDQLDIPSDIKTRILELIDMKSTQDESYMHSGETKLFEYMKTLLDLADSNFKGLSGGKGDMDKMNQFFIETLSK